MIISRFIFEHTGLKSLLYLMCMSDKCDVCNATENVEHLVVKCSKYDEGGEDNALGYMNKD